MARANVTLVLMAAALVLCGCVELKTVVTVEMDGRGTVEQTVYYTEMDAGAFGAAFGDAMGESTEEEKLATTRAGAEKMAEKMGEGVSLESVESLPPRNGRKGVRIVYAFEDVNQLHLDTLPSFTVSMDGSLLIGEVGGAMGGFPADGQFGEAPAGAVEQSDDQIRFEFSPAPKPTLTILTPEMTPPADMQTAPLDDPQAKAMATMMMQQMCDGMHLELQVAVKGRITDTNASYASRTSNTVGLYRMDFDKLVKNQAALEKLLSLDPTADDEVAKQQLQDPLLAEYFKLEMKDRVNVSFE
jgi:hypothetical protein